MKPVLAAVTLLAAVLASDGNAAVCIAGAVIVLSYLWHYLTAPLDDGLAEYGYPGGDQ